MGLALCTNTQKASRLHHSKALVHKGASRWRAKELAMSLCLPPAKKQWGGIKRGLRFQAQHQIGQEAPSLTENTEIIFSTQILQACCNAQRFKCTYLSSLHSLYWNKSLCSNKESFLLLMQMRNAWVLSHLLVGKNDREQKRPVDYHLQLTRADISPFFQFLSLF